MNDPVAPRTAANLVALGGSGGLSIPPPELPELCGIRVLSSPRVVLLRRESELLFQPPSPRKNPALVTLGGSGGICLLRRTKKRGVARGERVVR